MGRILQALKRAESNRPRPEETAVPRAYQPSGDTTAESESGEEMPFVEVGGPRPQTAPVWTFAPQPMPASPQQAPGPIVPGAVPEPPRPVPQAATAGSEPVPVAFQPVSNDHTDSLPARARFAAELVAFHQPEHAVSAQYRGLVAGLTAQLPAGRSQVLMCTAAAPGVGTTNVLLNIAVTLARQGQARVVVVDANLSRPAIAQRLGLPNVTGLQDVLAGYASLPGAVQETGLENLHALTAGDETADGPVRLAGEAMRSVLRRLRQRFDWVLLDGPCWDGRPETVALGSACDAVYLVLPQADAESADIAHLLKLIPEQGGQLRGCVLLRR